MEVDIHKEGSLDGAISWWSELIELASCEGIAGTSQRTGNKAGLLI